MLGDGARRQRSSCRRRGQRRHREDAAAGRDAGACAGAAGSTRWPRRGGELEGGFAFGIVRQLFEGPLAAAPCGRRADLLTGCGRACRSSPRAAPGPHLLTAPSPRSRCCTASTGLPPSSPRARRALLRRRRRALRQRGAVAALAALPGASARGLPLLLLVGTRPPEQANIPELRRGAARGSGRGGACDRLCWAEERRPLLRASASAMSPRRRSRQPSRRVQAATRSTSSRCSMRSGEQGLAPTAEHATTSSNSVRAHLHGISTRLGHLPADATDPLRAAAILGDRTDLSARRRPRRDRLRRRP